MKRQDVCNTCCIILSMQLSGTYGVELDDAKPRRVSDLLRDGFDGFSRSQKAIARYIIDHLEEVGYLSAEELGRKGSTSSSTVVRFAQSLGFAGYPELQTSGARRVPSRRDGAAGRPRRPTRLLHRGGRSHPVAQDRRPESGRDHQQEHAGALQPGRPPPGRRQAGARGGHARGVGRGAARVVRVRAPGDPLPRRHRQHRIERGPSQPAHARATCCWPSASAGPTRSPSRSPTRRRSRGPRSW